MKQNTKNRIIDQIAAELILRQEFSKLLLRQFLLGIAYGLGATLGAAIIGAVLIYVYRGFLRALVLPLF